MPGQRCGETEGYRKACETPPNYQDILGGGAMMVGGGGGGGVVAANAAAAVVVVIIAATATTAAVVVAMDVSLTMAVVDGSGGGGQELCGESRSSIAIGSVHKQEQLNELIKLQFKKFQKIKTM